MVGDEQTEHGGLLTQVKKDRLNHLWDDVRHDETMAGNVRDVPQ